MKVTNLRNRSLRIGEKVLNPGKTMTMADDKLEDVQSLLDEGFIKVEKVRITENKEG